MKIKFCQLNFRKFPAFHSKMDLQTYMSKEWKILSHLFVHWDILGGNNCQRFFLPFFKFGGKFLIFLWATIRQVNENGLKKPAFSEEWSFTWLFYVIFSTILLYILNTFNAKSFWALYILFTFKKFKKDSIQFSHFFLSFSLLSQNFKLNAYWTWTCTRFFLNNIFILFLIIFLNNDAYYFLTNKFLSALQAVSINFVCFWFTVELLKKNQ